MHSLSENAEKISKLLSLIHKNYHKKICAELDKGKFRDFTIQQITVMKEVYLFPEISLNDLSSRVNLANSTVSGIVERLAKKGVLLKVRPEENRRVVKISLSEEVKKDMEEITKIKNRYTVEILEKMESSDIELILNGLEKLSAELER